MTATNHDDQRHNLVKLIQQCRGRFLNSRPAVSFSRFHCCGRHCIVYLVAVMVLRRYDQSWWSRRTYMSGRRGSSSSSESRLQHLQQYVLRIIMMTAAETEPEWNPRRRYSLESWLRRFLVQLQRQFSRSHNVRCKLLQQTITLSLETGTVSRGLSVYVNTRHPLVVFISILIHQVTQTVQWNKKQ